MVISVSAKADLDVFLMKEGAVPCKAADGKTIIDTEVEVDGKGLIPCMKDMKLDSGGDPDPNYDQCLAGFDCMNNAMCHKTECFDGENGYDPDDPDHLKLFNPDTKKDGFDPKDHFSWPEDHWTFTMELAGATGTTTCSDAGKTKCTTRCADKDKTCPDEGKTCADKDKTCPTMKIFFSGDDYKDPVTETVVIEKTTEKISLWVYAYPDSGTVEGSVEYKFEKVSPCDV